MTFAKMKGKDIPVLVHIKAFKNVRLQIKVFIIANQPRIAINNRHADVF